jgi:cobalamin biosynthesis protein CobD/CbiB
VLRSEPGLGLAELMLVDDPHCKNGGSKSSRYHHVMGWFAFMLAVLAQRWVLVPHDSAVHTQVRQWVDRLGAATDAGARRDGVLAWLLVMVPLALGATALSWAVSGQGLGLTLVCHAIVLCLTVQIRAFSAPLGALQVALASGDGAQVRQMVQDWLRGQVAPGVAEERSLSEWCRLAMVRALEAAHRQIFGPLFWYVVLPGVIGPVVYRGAQLLAERWSPWDAPQAVDASDTAEVPGAVPTQLGRSVEFGAFAYRAYRVLDAVPLRLSAAGFAVVGNFEDAVYCWRAAAGVGGPGVQRRILEMAGGGALGVRLTEAEFELTLAQPPDAGPGPRDGAAFDWQGAEADAQGVRSAAGMLWRAVVLWLGVFAVLSVVGGWGH